MTASLLRERSKVSWKLPQGTHHETVIGETLDGGALNQHVTIGWTGLGEILVLR
jgi:hypothetical protein